MKDNILFGRLGNKTNDIKFFEQYLPFENIDTVIEPFGGCFALTRIKYSDNQYKKIVNDNDDDLYYLYTHPNEYYEFKNLMNKIAHESLHEYESVKRVNSVIFREKIKNLNVDEIFFRNFSKECIIRRDMIKIKKDNYNCEKFINIMKDIEFKNTDWFSLVNENRKNKNCFIFIDPPYLFSNNKYYDKCQSDKNNTTNDSDVTDIVYKIYEIFKDKTTKSKIMLIINDMKILRWLFKDYIKGDYCKKYGISQTRETHLIICNY